MKVGTGLETNTKGIDLTEETLEMIGVRVCDGDKNYKELDCLNIKGTPGNRHQGHGAPFLSFC